MEAFSVMIAQPGARDGTIWVLEAHLESWRLSLNLLGSAWAAEADSWDMETQPGWELVKYGWDLTKWLEHLAVNAKVAPVLGSIPVSSDTVESEGRQMKQCWIRKNPPLTTMPKRINKMCFGVMPELHTQFWWKNLTKISPRLVGSANTEHVPKTFNLCSAWVEIFSHVLSMSKKSSTGAIVLQTRPGAAQKLL